MNVKYKGERVCLLRGPVKSLGSGAARAAQQTESARRGTTCPRPGCCASHTTTAASGSRPTRCCTRACAAGKRSAGSGSTVGTHCPSHAVSTRTASPCAISASIGRCTCRRSRIVCRLVSLKITRYRVSYNVCDLPSTSIQSASFKNTNSFGANSPRMRSKIHRWLAFSDSSRSCFERSPKNSDGQHMLVARFRVRFFGSVSTTAASTRFSIHCFRRASHLLARSRLHLRLCGDTLPRTCVLRLLPSASSSTPRLFQASASTLRTHARKIRAPLCVCRCDSLLVDCMLVPSPAIDAAVRQSRPVACGYLPRS